MKTTHQSCQRCHWWSRFREFAALVALLFGVLPLLMAAVAWASPARSDTDSILTGPAPGLCANLTAGADYEGGTDAYGHPVTAAELPGSVRVTLDSETVYPMVGGRRGSQAEAKVTVHGLRSVLEAQSACPGY
ncbi:MAG: hypothetical protein KGR48_13155 [Alphaproteobacteria bacterium]|nr:hypothetical protein [Alphaproteobacteria bacterium]MBU6471850.1 hypothetical protein [Alphaproteobacteria bacterium]MDE2012037.1 hypothetical protein [Alphaproteobacteria bacterium]MDE2073865.1 hypothetical protein [Alphaproteobacteria bacterium]MDE2350516.1 hypothetical protein [Alphaproteobacteria bacterium]